MAETNVVSKKTKGRQKIQMKKIEKKTRLQVTFTKRRQGLFKKAAELSVLCGAEIAILLQSPAGKFFTYGHPSVDAVIDQLQTGVAVPAPSSLKMPEKEEKSGVSQSWWEEPIEGMKLEELEAYMGALQGLRANVLERLREMDKLKNNANPFTSTSSSAPIDFASNLEDFNPSTNFRILDNETRQILQKSFVMREEGSQSAHDQARSAITAVECWRTSRGYRERETRTSSNGFSWFVSNLGNLPLQNIGFELGNNLYCGSFVPLI